LAAWEDAVASQGPFVPRVVFNKLSHDQKKAARHRVLDWTKGHTKHSTIANSPAAWDDLVQEGFIWMTKLDSCEYLEGINGIDTIIKLACVGVMYAFREAKKQHTKASFPHREYDEQRLLASTDNPKDNTGKFISQDVALSHDATEKRTECCALLQDLFATEISNRRDITDHTRQTLLRIVGLIFDPNSCEDFYTVSDDRLGLKAEPIATVLGLTTNWVSKHAARILNEILDARRPAQANPEMAK
jgi:hypothetical protein